MGFQKPNNMQYRNLMDEHGEALLKDEPETDVATLVGDISGANNPYYNLNHASQGDSAWTLSCNKIDCLTSRETLSFPDFIESGNC
jgi:hypothetical protein